jgi:hypothetical protein
MMLLHFIVKKWSELIIDLVYSDLADMEERELPVNRVQRRRKFGSTPRERRGISSR